MEDGLGGAGVLTQDGHRGALRLVLVIAVVFLHHGDLELEVLLLFLTGFDARFFDGLEAGEEGVEVASDGLAAAQTAEEFELVRLDVVLALAVVDVQPNVDHLARVVLVLQETHLTDALRGAEKLDSDARGGPNLQLVVLGRNFLEGLIDVQAAAAPEDGDVEELAGQVGVVYVEPGVARVELGPQRVLQREAVLLGLEEGGLGQPGRRVNLKLVRVLAWLQVLSFGELDHDLLHANDFLFLPVVVLYREHTVSAEMSPFHALEFNDEV